MSRKRMPVAAGEGIPEAVAARKNLQRSRIISYLVTATEQLIRDEGIQQVTSRKIGMAAGYSSATIYTYFVDVDELILFASVGYLRDYVRTLSTLDLKSLNARERYERVTRRFTETMFRNPEIFYNMFFGRHRDQLDSILREYYAIFPEEISNLSDGLRQTIFEGSLYSRHRHMVAALVRDGFVSEASGDALTELAVRLQQSFLIELKEGQGDADAALARFCALFSSLLDAYAAR